MTTAATEPFAAAPAGEQRFVLHGVDWRTYCVLRELLDSPGLRMTYLEGALELMSPSLRHEAFKKMIARLIEVFALEREWFWIEDGFRLHRLGAEGYEPVASSAFLPGLDFELLARFVRRSDQPQAVREYREALSGRR
jgi:hypothetical protein